MWFSSPKTWKLSGDRNLTFGSTKVILNTSAAPNLPRLPSALDSPRPSEPQAGLLVGWTHGSRCGSKKRVLVPEVPGAWSVKENRSFGFHLLKLRVPAAGRGDAGGPEQDTAGSLLPAGRNCLLDRGATRTRGVSSAVKWGFPVRPQTEAGTPPTLGSRRSAAARRWSPWGWAGQPASLCWCCWRGPCWRPHLSCWGRSALPRESEREAQQSSLARVRPPAGTSPAGAAAPGPLRRHGGPRNARCPDGAGSPSSRSSHARSKSLPLRQPQGKSPRSQHGQNPVLQPGPSALRCPEPCQRRRCLPSSINLLFPLLVARNPPHRAGFWVRGRCPCPAPTRAARGEQPCPLPHASLALPSLACGVGAGEAAPLCGLVRERN